LTYVQTLEDKINKAVMTLDANAKVLESLNYFYANLAKDEDFELRTNSECKRAIADFTIQLRDFIYDTKMFSDRATTLAKITADRKSLVSTFICRIVRINDMQRGKMRLTGRKDSTAFPSPSYRSRGKIDPPAAKGGKNHESHCGSHTNLSAGNVLLSKCNPPPFVLRLIVSRH
jgi:hypothetical protein